MVRELIKGATDSLWQDLIFTEDDEQRFAVDLKNIDDNIALGTRSTSGAFLNFNIVTELAAGVKLIQDRLFKNIKARERMLSTTTVTDSNTRSIFKDSGLKFYERSVDKFLNNLFVLVHVTGGAPARGTEISCTRYRDGASVDRNLFTIGGKVIFISQYHKGMVIADRLKIIPRVLPKAVGDLVALYLRYVRPFTDSLDAIYREDKPETDYLWENSKGDCWSNNRMTQAIEEATERSLGVKLTVRSYRHIAVAFSRDVVHRSRPTAEQFKDFSSEDPLLDEAEGPEDYDAEQITAAQQTGHGVRQRLNHYGQAVNLTSKLTSKSLELFTRVSEEWHRFLGLGDDENGKRSSNDKKHRRQESSVNEEGNLGPLIAKRQRSFTDLGDARIETPKDINVHVFGNSEDTAHAILKDKFGHNKFKSEEQLKGAVSMLEKRPLTVAILPTGGGKTLLWMLPAAADQRGTTAVIVPYISLANDIIKRCGEVDLKADYWRPDCQSYGSRIIVAVTESAVGSTQHDINQHQTFLQYLSVLKANGLLNRIVVDECHTIVTEDGFRPAMSQMFHLRSLNVPMLFTTATLPPRMKTVFENSLALTDSPVRYIRGQSLRTNVSINVIKCGNGRMITTALELAKERKRTLTSGQKIVIYTRFKNEAEMLAGPKMLDCQFYHGEADEKARRLTLDEWQKPEQTFLIATTAFGYGIDYPNIIETIHVKLPYSLINYVQESGRAGKHFEKSKSTVIIEEREMQAMKDEDGRMLVRVEFSAYDAGCLRSTIVTTGCRLIPISRFLNGGEGKNCDKLLANSCDNCRKVEKKETKSEIVKAVEMKT